MDNKQILEEIDIIVRAKVNEARNDLKRVSKDTTQMVNSISKDIKNLKNTSSLDSLYDGISESVNNMKPSIEEAKNKITELQDKIEDISSAKDGNIFKVDEIRKYKGQVEDLKKNLTSLNGEDVSLDLNYEELEQQLNSLVQERDALVDKFRSNNSLFSDEDDKRLDELVLKIRDIENEMLAIPKDTSFEIKGESSFDNDLSIPEIDMSNSRDEIIKTKDEVYSLEEQLKNFDCLTIREQIKVVGMQLQQTFPQINSLVNEFQERIKDTGSVLGLFVSSLQKVSSFGKTMGSKLINPFIKLKTTVSSAFTSVFQTVKAKIGPYEGIMKNVGKISKNAFVQASSEIKVYANKFKAPINKVKNLIKHLKDLKKEKGEKEYGSDFVKGMSSSFKAGIKSIKKFALSLLSIRTAFSAVSKAAQAYLSFDSQLSDSIQNSWNVLGSLLAPVLEYVASLFSKLVSIVATFVKALSGVDLVARANKKSLDAQTKSAKSASNQLASIDDIDVLNTNGSGGESTTLTVEEIDITPLEVFMNKAKEILSKIFEPFQLAWENVGSGVIDGIVNAITGLQDLGTSVMSSIFEVWTNGTGQEIIENIILVWTDLLNIIGEVATAISNAWNNADTGTNIIQTIANFFKDIQKFSLLITDSLLKWVVSEEFQEALNKVFEFIGDIFEIVEDVASWTLEMYDKYLKPVIDDKLLPAINDIITALSDVWNFVKPLVVDWIIPLIKNQLEPIIKGLCDFIGGIIDIVSGIAKFVSGVFTGNWKKAWEGIKKIFKGIWDSISAIIKTPINTVLSGIEFMVNKLIGGFNKLIKSINKISFDVPDWIPVIGGQKWGFNLKESKEISIPRLAKGDVAYEETQVIVGEYANARHNPEIISPVSMMEDTFDRVLSNHDSDGNRIDRLVINLAGRELLNEMIDEINEESARKGVNVVKER